MKCNIVGCGKIEGGRFEDGICLPCYEFITTEESIYSQAYRNANPVELTDEEIEQVRVAIMGVAYWCADENMPEAYNAVKVCCSQVLGILRKAQEK